MSGTKRDSLYTVMHVNNIEKLVIYMKTSIDFTPDPWERKRIKQLRDMLAKDPNDTYANYNLGNMLLDICQNEDALVCFDRVLQQDSTHMGSWIGKGRVLIRKEDYDGAQKCFEKVPPNDEMHNSALQESKKCEYYEQRRRQMLAYAIEDSNATASLEKWMTDHLDHVKNMHKLLHKFRYARDDNKLKAGNVFHADLVRSFYEDRGPHHPLKVIAVECKDTIEPKTDVDIVLSGDIYLQVWHGKMPLGHTLDNRFWSNDNTQLYIDWCEELKPVKHKLEQLPSNTGKGFVLNFTPGLPPPLPAPLYSLCSERKCVMTMTYYNDKPHIIVFGTSDFKYRDEACRIARVLKRPLKFILGDWDELRKQGRNPMNEAAYGSNVSHDFVRLRNNKEELLKFAKTEIKHPYYDNLVALDSDTLFWDLLSYQMLNDDDCKCVEEKQN